MWRLHFVGGFLAAPIMLSLAVTGILFAWNPQMERAFLSDTLVPSGPAQVSLAGQVEAVRQEHPDAMIISVEPGDAETNTGVLISPGGIAPEGFGGPPDGQTVYVDEASGAITGTLTESDRPAQVIREWHSSWGLGQPAESLTELAGSWLLVAIITGLYLWWPRTRAAWRRTRGTWLPRISGRGTRRWRELHTSIGLWMTPVLLVLVITGLTWTEYAGDNIRVLRDAFAGEAPQLDTALAATNGETTTAQASWANVDGVVAAARSAGLDQQLVVTAPPDDGTAWTVAQNDVVFPLDRDQVAVDARTGEVTSMTRFADTPLMSQLTTYGILWHQAELFGLLGQIGMTALALGVVAAIVFGYVLWWRRRPKGEVSRAPKAGRLIRTTPIGIGLVAILLGVLLPTLGVAFLAFLVLERIYSVVIRRRGWKPPVDLA